MGAYQSPANSLYITLINERAEMRYRYNSCDWCEMEDGIESIYRFDDTKEDAEVRVYLTNGELTDCIKVWYPTTNWETFKPTAYMLDKAYAEYHNERAEIMSKHIVDEVYRGHEIIFIEQSNGFITVDIRADDFDGEFIAGYTDFLDIANARNRACGYIDGFENVKGYQATRQLSK